MRELGEQIRSGQLVCPVSKKALVWRDDELELHTEDGAYSYPVRAGIPVLLTAPPFGSESSSMKEMTAEYERAGGSGAGWRDRLNRWLSRDYRSLASLRALDEVIGSLETSSLAISIGGGPGRAHPNLCNVNIGPFPNVEVVGDAHNLPYANDSVAAVFCEAVLEHVASPEVVVTEMKRVLIPEGRVLAITPFLQAYHGYPDHYRNFTLSGHKKLFTDAGFRIESAGTCVGPVFTILNLTGTAIGQMAPNWLSRFLQKVWAVATLPIQPLDRFFNNRPDAHVLASTTFVVARKPSRADA